ncbi:uncharacterized protein DSM5745_09704 [Aspergillus mulundensis]|uniref:Uncharacterized protein n=1 Tax=Aspergillus mulundensis TaxID=1810919 RepID=A0A3D8QR51_9EURO|nr:hypothetical protein DSM5745_09704 [Aspergillus mulundensis]RDW64293.1 hypothetical protein DSM5745_09704 [Aspergillus mulundensis]
MFKAARDSTPDSSPPCSSNTCGAAGDEACPPQSSGTWLTIEPPGGAEIPTVNVAALPSERERSYLAAVGGVPKQSRQPLSDLATFDSTPYVRRQHNSINRKQAWFTAGPNPVTAWWHEFLRPDDRNSRLRTHGIDRITGCTVVFIISRKGIWTGHIKEDPVFVDRQRLPTPDRFIFEAFVSLTGLPVAGNEALNLRDLVGDEVIPGPLHRIYRPQVIVLTPFARGNAAPLRYHERAHLLAEEFSFLVYPDGPPMDEGPMISGYEVETRNSRKGAQRVLFELAVRDREMWRVVEFQDQRLWIGRWRLWMHDKHVMEPFFWDEQDWHTAKRSRRDQHPIGDQTVTREDTAMTTVELIERSGVSNQVCFGGQLGDPSHGPPDDEYVVDLARKCEEEITAILRPGPWEDSGD